MQAINNTRILALDGLRALAMLSVFLYHTWAIPLSWMGVDIFFVLSGFLITGILLERKGGPGYFSEFYGRRARRILAPYYLLLILSSALFGMAWLKQWYWYLFFASNFPNAFQTVPHESLDVLWSLAVEEQFYVLWPVAVLFLSETALTRTAIGLILLAPVLRGIATPLLSSSAPIYHIMPFRMDLLSAGALIALVWRRSPHLIGRYRRLGPTITACATLVILYLSGFEWFRTSAHNAFTNVALYSLAVLISAGLLLGALQTNGVFIAFLRNSVLQFLGRMSYSMYLVHVCFILLAQRCFSNRLSVSVMAFLATMAYSTISWFILERRLLRSSRSSAVTALEPALVSSQSSAKRVA